VASCALSGGEIKLIDARGRDIGTARAPHVQPELVLGPGRTASTRLVTTNEGVAPGTYWKKSDRLQLTLPTFPRRPASGHVTVDPFRLTVCNHFTVEEPFTLDWQITR
jgi:hypothetical protein